MKIISTVSELQTSLKRAGLKPVGFVATMGALHQGHLSLVKNAIDDNPLVVVSIFVNPTQFNDKEDLNRYPRTPEADISLLGTELRDQDLIFMPGVSDIYPSPDTRVFNFGNLDNVMEASHRPGHFNGVGQVVSRLFEIVGPNVAYFGQKDFQQVAVIRELVRQLKFNIKIVSSPIIREPDGLAMSSRNRLLESGIRNDAPVIFRTISKAAEMIREHDIPFIIEFVKECINEKEGFAVEYFEIADEVELGPCRSKKEMKKGVSYYGCIAVKAGKIRLIDNIELPLV
jgi:pantoate--beta-alanine ligase